MSNRVLLALIFLCFIFSGCTRENSQPVINEYAVQFNDSHIIEARDTLLFALCDDYTVYADYNGSFDVYDVTGNLLYLAGLEETVSLAAIGEGIDPDSFIVICQTYDNERYSDNQLRTYSVNNDELKLIDSKPVDASLDSEYFTVYPCADKQGYYVFDIIHNRIAVIDLNGDIVDSIQYKDSIVSGYPLIDETGLHFITASDLSCLSNSDLYINHYHDGKIDRKELESFLPKEMDGYESFSLIRSDYDNSDFFFLVSSGLYSVNDDEVKKVGETFPLKILSGGYDRSIVIKDNLAFICNPAVVLNGEVTTIDVGCLGNDDEMNDLFVLFELMNPDIKINIRSYFDESEFENVNDIEDYREVYNQQLHKLLADLNKKDASGIDILYLPYDKQQSLIDQDILEEYKPDAFDEGTVFDSVQRMINDKFSQRLHFQGFNIRSLAVLAEFYDEYNGTFDSLCDIFLRNDVPLVEEIDNMDFDEWIYGGIINGKLSEDNIRALLEYIKSHGDYQYDSECLISMPTICSIEDYYDFRESYETVPVMLGYPYCSEGPYIKLDNTFSILSCSDNLTASHRFIDFLYSDISGKVEMKYGKIPSNMEAAKDFSGLDNLLSANDEYFDGVPTASDNSYEAAEKARQDKKNAILENRDSLINDFFRYIESAKDVLVYDDYMMSIIIEETNSMFLEDKDPSEAAKLIVSRVEMYFAERK